MRKREEFPLSAVQNLEEESLSQDKVDAQNKLVSVNRL